MADRNRGRRFSRAEERRREGKHSISRHIPESVADAYELVHAIVARDDRASLEEMQGAVELLLDRIRLSRGPDG